MFEFEDSGKGSNSNKRGRIQARMHFEVCVICGKVKGTFLLKIEKKLIF